MRGMSYWAQAAATPFSRTSVEKLHVNQLTLSPDGISVLRRVYVQGELDLNGMNLDVLDRFMDSLSADLRQRDAVNLPGLDILLVHDAEGLGHGDSLVATSELEEVDLLATLQLSGAVVNRAAGVLGRAVAGMGFRVHTPLDAEDNLVGVFGILFQIALQEYQAIVVGRAVELAAVPEVA